MSSTALREALDEMKIIAGVPVSGGVYYIHIKSPVGERVIKWFSMQRVPDLNTF